MYTCSFRWIQYFSWVLLIEKRKINLGVRKEDASGPKYRKNQVSSVIRTWTLVQGQQLQYNGGYIASCHQCHGRKKLLLLPVGSTSRQGTYLSLSSSQSSYDLFRPQHAEGCLSLSIGNYPELYIYNNIIWLKVETLTRLIFGCLSYSSLIEQRSLVKWYLRTSRTSPT